MAIFWGCLFMDGRPKMAEGLLIFEGINPPTVKILPLVAIGTIGA